MNTQTPLADITSNARTALRGNWGQAIGVVLVYNLLIQSANLLPGFGGLVVLLYSGPLLAGLCAYLLALHRGNSSFSQIFDGFNFFGKALGAYLLRTLYIFLWSLLLVIPGMIKAYSYSMTFFILADNPSMGINEAITHSRELMDGNKGRLLCLYVRFIGWSFLCILTLGIGTLWLIPYISAAVAAFYEDIKD
jgi:uncharacterized membrane protein